MIAVANRIHVNPEYTEAFEKRFRARAGLVDEMSGFLFNQVLRPTKAGDPYVVLTYWERAEDFRAWVASDAFQKGHARSGSLPEDAFSGPNTLEVHQIIQDSRDPDAEVPERLEFGPLGH